MNRSLQTKDIVGEMIGLSGVKITKLLLIEKENDEFIDLIDRGILTIHQAYIQLSRNKEEKDSRANNRKNIFTSDNSNIRFYNKCSSKMEELKDEEVSWNI